MFSPLAKLAAAALLADSPTTPAGPSPKVGPTPPKLIATSAPSVKPPAMPTAPIAKPPSMPKPPKMNSLPKPPKVPKPMSMPKLGMFSEYVAHTDYLTFYRP